MQITKSELDAARLELLRRKITHLGLVVGIILLGITALQAWVALELLQMPPTRSTLLRIFASAFAGLAFIVSPRLRRGRFANTSLRRMTWRTAMLVLVAVIGQAAGAEVLAKGITEGLRHVGFQGNIGPMFPLAFFMVCIHTAAALTVPWTTLEACIPPVGLAALSLGLSLTISNDSPDFRVYGVLLPLVAGIPGVTITYFRSHGLRELFGLRLIGERYAEVERELGTARRIHERLFPAQVTEGPLRMSYYYGPMSQLGGDYLDASMHADGSMVLTLVDVTGHGVAAALAVNRLHGELKRTIAQQSSAGPARIIEALNEYIYLTLADEQVFATAISLRASPDGAVVLCVAGHPPAMIRRANGSVEQIDSTAPALGMLPNADLGAEESTCRLAKGDLLLLYTDGAIEIWNEAKVQLGVDGMKRAVARMQVRAGDTEALVTNVVQAVEAYRHGATDDDTLVVAIARA